MNTKRFFATIAAATIVALSAPVAAVADDNPSEPMTCMPTWQYDDMVLMNYREVENLNEENDRLTRKVRKQEARIADLKAQIKRLKNNR